MIKFDPHCHLGHQGKTPSLDELVPVIEKNLGRASMIAYVQFASWNDLRGIKRFCDEGKIERQIIGNTYPNPSGIYIPSSDITILFGQEIPTKQGEIIALCSQRYMQENMNLDYTISAVEDEGGIIIAPHVFYKDGIGPALEKDKSLLNKITSLEVQNSSAYLWLPFITPKNANQKAIYFYDEIKNDYNVGICAGSDCYLSNDIGKGYTFIPNLRGDLIFSLKNSLASVKSLDDLHSEPNRIGALKHCIHLAKNMIFK